jgi:hypothetical protein
MSGGAAWVFHRGALGDSILTWPILRAMRMEFDEVAFVADGEKAALAERVLNSGENAEWKQEFCTQRAQRTRSGEAQGVGEEIGTCGRGRGEGAGLGVVVGVDAEQGFFSSLWRESGAGVSGVGGGASAELGATMAWPARLPREPRIVVAFLGRNDEAAARWCGNVGRLVPGARVQVIEERLDRRVALRLACEFGGGSGRGRSACGSGLEFFVEGCGVLIENDKTPHSESGATPGRRILLHVGAGSVVKRWAMERYVGVARAMRGRGFVVELIGGEVELERLTSAERAAFFGAGGQFVGSLVELERRIRGARVFVGADSGPTHLAGQLGVETVALFGPTEVEAWAPIGPRVRVIGPESVRGMEWIEEGMVVAAIESAMASSEAKP